MDNLRHDAEKITRKIFQSSFAKLVDQKGLYEITVDIFSYTQKMDYNRINAEYQINHIRIIDMNIMQITLRKNKIIKKNKTIKKTRVY